MVFNDDATNNDVAAPAADENTEAAPAAEENTEAAPAAEATEGESTEGNA